MMSESPQTMYANWIQELMKQSPLQEWMKSGSGGMNNPFSQDSSILSTLKEYGAEIDPAVLNRLQSEYLSELGNLWKDFISSKLPQFDDRRFLASDWHQQTNHAYNVAIYLLNARFLGLLAESVQAPEKKKQKIRFAVQQMVDAMSPANFLATNPEAQAKLIETGGESLMKGMTQML